MNSVRPEDPQLPRAGDVVAGISKAGLFQLDNAEPGNPLEF